MFCSPKFQSGSNNSGNIWSNLNTNWRHSILIFSMCSFNEDLNISQMFFIGISFTIFVFYKRLSLMNRRRFCFRIGLGWCGSWKWCGDPASHQTADPTECLLLLLGGWIYKIIVSFVAHFVVMFWRVFMGGGKRTEFCLCDWYCFKFWGSRGGNNWNFSDFSNSTIIPRIPMEFYANFQGISKIIPYNSK